VRMRAALPFLLAAVLGVATAPLAACGSGGGDRRDLIPPRSADRLKSALSDVRQAVDDGDCDTAARAVARARGRLVLLPRSVDDRLVARLRQGIDNLDQVAQRQCQEQQTTTTETTTETTTPETTPEETATTETSTTSTTPTTPTETTTTPTTPTTDTGATTPPESTPTAPPADTTGGTGNP
jgi:hypothetical protein